MVSEACGVSLCAELRSVGPLGFLSQQESGLWGFFCELAWGVRVLLSLWGSSLSLAGMFCVWGLSLGVSGISGTSTDLWVGPGFPGPLGSLSQLGHGLWVSLFPWISEVSGTSGEHIFISLRICRTVP